MGVVDVREMFRGVGRQTTYGDVPVYTRIFLVRTDCFVNNGVTFQEISEAPGIGWLDAHPENSEALLIESTVQPEGDSPFHWRLVFTYKTATDILETPWDRPPQFSFSGSLASAPAFWHYPNSNDNNTKQIIINSAGDPIGGLDKDEAEFTVSISLNLYPPGAGTPYFDVLKSQQYVGAINSDTWSGGAPKTWKCQSITANRKIEQVAGNTYIYWEANTTIAYRNTGWDLQTWDVGFNEIVGGSRRKIMAGAEPVSEPAALSNGRAKAPGQPPDMKMFRIYPMLPFNGTFPPFPTG